MLVDLSSSVWTLSTREVNEKYQDIPVEKLPSVVHMELFRNNLISDPYKEYNELEQQWVANNDWIYETTVDVSKLLRTRTFLVLEGLDTICNVSIDGKDILETNNMFVQHVVDISDHINHDRIKLRLHFHSSLKYCKTASEHAKYPIPCPEYTQCFPTPGRNYLRKVGCDFGWDWGPCFVPCGITKPIYLLSATETFIENVVVHQTNHVFEDHNCTSVDLQIKTYLHGQEGVTLEYAILDPTSTGFEAVLTSKHIRHEGNFATFSTTLENPKLWYPNGYGDQPLYTIVVKIANQDENQFTTKTVRVGIRELILDTDADTIGSKFTFRVNRQTIYAKGSNWIPSDCFSSRITTKHISILLKSARDAHQNMMRIWGGGAYETNEFYELCDTYGILLWHDMMFACSLYPSDAKFLSSVRTEIQQQVRRIQHHPCIALYAGNNENEEALYSWPDAQDDTHRQKYLIDYYKLYYDTIYEILKQEDPLRPYLPSSPTNGLNAWGFPQDLTRGDAHYWSVWHKNMPFSTYRTVTPRFSSEFGFQSIPSISLLKQYVGSEMNITSPAIEFRQRSFAVGNKCILEHMTREFRLPKDFASTVYLSQVNQAIAIKTACEHWRRQKEICSGTLYWQLNDIWPGMSWSSIEWNCEWKLLHYAAVHFYSPVLLSMYEEGYEVKIWMTSDEHKHITGELAIQLVSFKDGSVQKEWSVPVDIGSNKSAQVFTIDTQELFGTKLPYYEFISENSIGRTKSFLQAKFNPRDITVNGGNDISNLLFFVPLKSVAFQDATITAKWIVQEGDVWELEVSSNEVAPFVYLRLEAEQHQTDHYNDIPRCAGRFSDNGFLLHKNEKKKIKFFRFDDAKRDLKLLASSLSATYL